MSTTKNRTRQIAWSTLVVVIAFTVTKAISLAQTFLIANVFGVGREWDNYVIAQQITDQITALIGGIALLHSFIPIFAGYLARSDKAGAWRISSYVINTFFLLTLVLSLFVILAAPTLVAASAPGFDTAGQADTVRLVRILAFSTVIMSISGVVMGILQSHNHFLLPALAPIMLDIGILFGAGFLIRPFGIEGMAYGAVLGGMLHLGIQIPGLIRYRLQWQPVLGWRDKEFWTLIRLMLPRMASVMLFNIEFLVMSNIASRLGTGSVSALSWGWRLMQIPETLIGTAMGTVIFPTLASLSATGDKTGKRDAMAGAVRFILILTIPSSIGLILVGRSAISLLERGAFDASASDLVFSALSGFALGLVVHSVLEVVARSFYADKDTLTPLLIGVVSTVINVVLAFILSGVQQVEQTLIFNPIMATFQTTVMSLSLSNIGGVTLANSLAVTFEVIALLIILRRRWQGIAEGTLGVTLLKTTFASLAMGLGIVLVDLLWNAAGLADRGLTFTIAQISVEMLVGIGVFVLVAVLLKMQEINFLLRLIRRRARMIEAAT
jgi:putative peptidoglycan lipid II flippase